MASKGSLPELDMTRGEDWLSAIPTALKEADKSTAGQILSGLKAYVNALEQKEQLGLLEHQRGAKGRTCEDGREGKRRKERKAAG